MNRRQFIQNVSAVSLGACAPPTAWAQDNSLTGTIADIHFKMRSGLRGANAYWHYSGTVFGKIEGEKTIPLTGMEGLIVSQATDMGTAGWRLQKLQRDYYIDLETKEPLDTWRNPLNGKLVKPQSKLGSGEFTCTPNGVIQAPSKIPTDALDYSGIITPHRSFAGRVWSSEDVRVKISDPISPLTLTRLKTYSSPFDQMSSMDTEFVDCQVNFQTMGSWRKWMLMDGTPGVLSLRLVSQKVATADELPKHLLNRVLSEHSNFLEPLGS